RAADLPPPAFRDPSSSASTVALRVMNEAEVRALMWRSVGVFRDREPLREGVNHIKAQERALEEPLAGDPALDHDGWRLASIITVASIIAKAALRREESRGGHFRTDFPAHDDLHWKTHISDVIHRP